MDVDRSRKPAGRFSHETPHAIIIVRDLRVLQELGGLRPPTAPPSLSSSPKSKGFGGGVTK